MTNKSTDELIQENENLVHFVLQRKYPTRANDDDAIQSGLIGLWKAIQQYEPERNIKFSTYAYRCISNEILTFIRKESRQTQLTLMPLTDDVEDSNQLPKYDMQQEEQLSLIDALTYTDALLDEDKFLLRLYLEGYSVTDVGKILGITKQAVCARMIRIRNTVRKVHCNDN